MGQKISAAEALKAFKTKPTVQVARQVKAKNDKGQDVTRYEVEEAKLAEAHITGAVKRDDGKVVVSTVDGQKHEADA